jgi:site-specific DNA-methyltransferase (adenine-specific)
VTCTCKSCGKPFEAPPAHRLLCGDSRNEHDVARLFAGAKANVAITSPPYASQRKYDESSGFKPIPPDDYVEWFRDVAANIAAVLAPDGSYFLNIKEHAKDGERSLYVKDLVLAHKRVWAWRFIDEFCWRNTANGVPGSWPDRFKNAWEPVFHFAREKAIKFRAIQAGHDSGGLFETGSRGHGDGRRFGASGAPLYSSEDQGKPRSQGTALPSNVIETKCESGQGDHSAPFPRALVEFFVKAFSDAGDIIYDPFMGSGTTMAAAHVLQRAGYGCEISPGYCDVIVRRLIGLGATARLEATGQTFDEVKAERTK